MTRTVQCIQVARLVYLVVWKDKCNSPSDLLDNLAHESGTLAQVTLGVGDTGPGDAGGGLLYFTNLECQRPSSAMYRTVVEGVIGGASRDPPGGETWVVFSDTTYVAAVGTDGDAASGGCFLCHLVAVGVG